MCVCVCVCVCVCPCVCAQALQGHTPDWNRTSPAQTPFYIEQRCIPLQGKSVCVCVCVCVCVGRFRNSRLRSPTAAEGPKHAGSLLGSQRTGLQHREGNMQNEVRMRSAVTGQRGKVKGHLGGLQKNTQKIRTHTHTHTYWWQRAP